MTKEKHTLKTNMTDNFLGNSLLSNFRTILESIKLYLQRFHQFKTDTLHSFNKGWEVIVYPVRQRGMDGEDDKYAFSLLFYHNLHLLISQDILEFFHFTSIFRRTKTYLQKISFWYNSTSRVFLWTWTPIFVCPQGGGAVLNCPRHIKQCIVTGEVSHDITEIHVQISELSEYSELKYQSNKTKQS